MTGSLTDVPGLTVGHWTDADAATGCTVVLCDGEGAAVRDLERLEAVPAAAAS